MAVSVEVDSDVGEVETSEVDDEEIEGAGSDGVIALEMDLKSAALTLERIKQQPP